MSGSNDPPAEDELGSGPALDENFDWGIGSSGGPNISSAFDELAKDLRYRLRPALEDFRGGLTEKGSHRDAVTSARTAISEDERIRRVVSVGVEFDDDTVLVEVEAITSVGPFSGVIDV